MAADEVQLTDLRVIQRYSVAVRAASAPLDEVVAALRSDLEHLTGIPDKKPRARRPAAGAADA